MDISKAWGYGAVVMPKTGRWQSFLVPDPEDPRLVESVNQAISIALGATENIFSIDRIKMAPVGAMAGAVVSALDDDDWDKVAVFTAALSKMSGYRFWVIEAEGNIEQDGLVVKHIPLRATTPEEACDMIKRMREKVQVDQQAHRGVN